MSVRGLRFWNPIWYGILALGLLGLISSLYWGRRTHWRNLDELIRSCGTILVSVGMLFLLNRVASGVGEVLMIIALGCFIAAFILGRRQPPPPAEPGDTPGESRNRA